MSGCRRSATVQPSHPSTPRMLPLAPVAVAAGLLWAVLGVQPALLAALLPRLRQRHRPSLCSLRHGGCQDSAVHLTAEMLAAGWFCISAMCQCVVHLEGLCMEELQAPSVLVGRVGFLISCCAASIVVKHPDQAPGASSRTGNENIRSSSGGAGQLCESLNRAELAQLRSVRGSAFWGPCTPF